MHIEPATVTAIVVAVVDVVVTVRIVDSTAAGVPLSVVRRESEGTEAGITMESGRLSPPTGGAASD